MVLKELDLERAFKKLSSSDLGKLRLPHGPRENTLTGMLEQYHNSQPAKIEPFSSEILKSAFKLTSGPIPGVIISSPFNVYC